MINGASPYKIARLDRLHVALMLHGAAAAIWKSLEMNSIMLHMLHVWTLEIG
jgi:hypothetical protein